MSTSTNLARDVLLTSDPHASYLAHQPAIDAAVRRVLDSGRYLLGAESEAFEEEFARYLGAAHCVACASGTDALELALRAASIGAGDVVFTVSHTSVATVAAIEAAGAVPVLLEVDPVTYTMDVEDLAETIRWWRSRSGNESMRPKAVVPVHLYGHPADLTAISRLARENGLMVIEDCAQAHGAEAGGRKVGTWGDFAAFSFYPTKNLGALGDGGAVVMTDAARSCRVRQLRQYGRQETADSLEPGRNSRLDEIQAAVLRVKLPHLDHENEQRRSLAKLYREQLAGVPVQCPQESAGVRHVYHQFVIRSKRRDALKQQLEHAGIEAGIHYPQPVHRQTAYRGRLASGVRGWLRTENLCQEILSLPMYPQLDVGQVRRVTSEISAFETS